MSPSPVTRRDFLRLSCATGVGVCASAFDGLAQLTPDRAGAERTLSGIRWCWCPPGRFIMGSPDAEPGHRPDEVQTPVTLSRGFWLAKFETTQRDWQRIAGAFPGPGPSATFGLGDDVPVYWVTFPEAEAFCRRLTDHT